MTTKARLGSLGVRVKRPDAPPTRPELATGWDTDDGEIEVTLACGDKREAEVQVRVSGSEFLIASSLGDLDEMIDILTRCRIVASRYKLGEDTPEDDNFSLRKTMDHVQGLVDHAKIALEAGNAVQARRILDAAEAAVVRSESGWRK